MPKLVCKPATCILILLEQMIGMCGAGNQSIINDEGKAKTSLYFLSHASGVLFSPQE